ncbi:bleomycin resistance protein [Mucilaginibacter sp.]|jgi:catechol 2,3-dioxygenase-like lactoylglutathione lyase family enzyme|uniref:bleomycin resistance protein n=1 Tax=Mucilaginibacter sp. TaxID=1882438 RepID=UPI003563FDA5
MVNFKKSIPALPVVSIKKAVDFYKTKMGFHARHQEDSFAVLVRGSVEIHLWQACYNGWKWKSIFLFLSPVSCGAESFLAGTASCRIEVEGIDELYQEYKAQGVLHHEHSVIEEQYWGDRDLATLDLYGNLITFYEVMN